MEIHIRRGRRTDYAALAALCTWPAAEGNLPRLFRRAVADLGYDLYVAEEGGRAIGVVAVSYVRALGLGGQRATLEELVVDPEEAGNRSRSPARGVRSPSRTPTRSPSLRGMQPRCRSRPLPGTRGISPLRNALLSRVGGRSAMNDRAEGASAARAQDPGEVYDREIRRRFSPAEAESMIAFARGLYAREGARYAAELGAEESLALVASAFRFFALPPDRFPCRLRTPTAATDGWNSPYTIFESHLSDRPFIVDTIREFFHRRGAAVRYLLHPIYSVERDAAGAIVRMRSLDTAAQKESFVHCAIDRLPEAELPDLEQRLTDCLGDVRAATDDYRKMRDRLAAVRAELASSPESETEEARQLLGWLGDGNFVFLGYGRVERSSSGEGPRGRFAEDSTLGILRIPERAREIAARDLQEAPDAADPHAPLMVTRSLVEAPVHRFTRMDMIVVRRLEAGRWPRRASILRPLHQQGSHRDPCRDSLAPSEARPHPGRRAGVARFARFSPDRARSSRSCPRRSCSRSPPRRFAPRLRRSARSARVKGCEYGSVPARARFGSRSWYRARDFRVKYVAGSRRCSPSSLALPFSTTSWRWGRESERACIFTLARRLARCASTRSNPASPSTCVPGTIGCASASSPSMEPSAVARSPSAMRASSRPSTKLPPISRPRSTTSATSRCSARRASVEIDLDDAVGPDADRFTLLKLYVRGEGIVLSDFLPLLENLGLRVFAEDSVALGAG